MQKAKNVEQILLEALDLIENASVKLDGIARDSNISQWIDRLDDLCNEIDIRISDEQQ